MRNSRTRTAAIAICIAAVLTPAVTACGSGSSGKTTAQQPATASAKATNKPTSSATASPTSSSAPTATGPTIQLGWCTDGGHGVRAVQLLDPQTKHGEIRYFPVEPLVYESNADCNSNLEGYKARSTFDKYFNRLAAQSVKNDDGTYRAGYIAYVTGSDAYNTTFTDLSGISDDTPNGSIGVKPKQSKSYFGRDGMLNFVEDTGTSYQLMTVHPSEGSVPAKSADDQDVDGITPEDSTEYVYTLPNEDEISPGYERATTEDDHWVSAGDGYIAYGQGNEKGKHTESQYGKTLYPVWVNPEQPTEFIGWDNEKQIVRATISGGKVIEKPVLADPGGKISEVTVDPTGTQAAFILEKVNGSNSTTSLELYTVSLKGTGTNQPKLVKDLLAAGIPTDSFRIYGWSTVPSES